MALGASVCWDISHVKWQRYFLSDKFHWGCNIKYQEQYFSGVGAQHQNVRAERIIKTTMYTARIFIVHYYLHQIDHGADKISLWYFAVNHYVWFHNRLPNYCSVITWLVLLTRNKAYHCDLSWSHVLVCLVFVLHPKLQNHKNIPTWNHCSLFRKVPWSFITALWINCKFPQS